MDMPMHQERTLPQFTLREIDLPEVRTWEVNDDYYIVMKVKMIAQRNQRESGYPADAQKMEGDFEVLSIKPLGELPVDAKELERQDFEKIRVQALRG